MGVGRRKHLSSYQAALEFRFSRRRFKRRGLVFQRAPSASVVSAPPHYRQVVGRRNGKTPPNAVA